MAQTTNMLSSNNRSLLSHLFMMLWLYCRPMDLAQSATLFFIGDALTAAALIFSCIFSQTRGTPRKHVGRTSFSVVPKDPCKDE